MLNVSLLILGLISLVLPFYGFANAHFFFVNLGLLLCFDSLYGFNYKRVNLGTHYKNLIVMFFLSIGFWEIIASISFHLQLWQDIYKTPRWLGAFQYDVAHGLIIPVIFVMIKALFPKRAQLEVAAFPWRMELLVGAIIFILSLLLMYFNVFVWLGIFFILDAICYHETKVGVLALVKHGLWKPVFSIVLVSLILGFFWEGYNQLDPQWQYTFKGFQYYSIFGMPILGYLGYIPFVAALFNFYLIMEDLVLSSKDALAK
jgi:hypothetical protein